MEGMPDPVVSDATALLQQFLFLSARFERRLSAELGVNATDYRAMEHLLRSGSLTAGELARRLGISQAATTTAVDRLTRQGHVRRETDPADRRRVKVVATDDSNAAAGDLIMPMVHDLDAQLRDLPADQQRVVTDYLRRVVEALRTHADGE